MKVVSSREFARVLERHGWKLLRIKGSQPYLRKARQCCSLVSPDSWRPNIEDWPAGHLMKLAGLSEEDLT